MNKFIKNRYVRLVIIAISLFLSIGLLRSIIGNLNRGDVVARRQAVLRNELERNQVLKEKLREATSASFIEGIARNKLGLAKEGETIVLVGDVTPETESKSNTSTLQQSQWTRWWRLFF